METRTPTIADVLDPWLEGYAAERTGRRLERIVEVGARFRRCLDAELARIATAPELRLVEHERGFGTPDAAARTVSCEGLPVLALLMVTERWLPADATERRAQLQVLTALQRWMSAASRADRLWSACAVLDLGYELRQLRAGEPARSLD